MIKKILACSIAVGLMIPNTVSATPKPAVTYESAEPIPLSWSHRKGLRFGYNYVNNGAEKTAINDNPRLSSPHMFAIGFELNQKMAGGDWLDILFIQNGTISGLEQSLIIPSANVLVGFEINNALQLAVGANVAPADPAGDDNYIHLVTAVGWTQQAGSLSVPLHLVFIPDVNDYWRCAVTTGVNW